MGRRGGGWLSIFFKSLILEKRRYIIFAEINRIINLKLIAPPSDKMPHGLDAAEMYCTASI
jgi:hypothetical protein